MNYSSLGKKKVLVAEDVELNQVIVKHIMESWGFEVAIACDGVQALKMVGENRYDLVLMDIQMPEMDGIAATQEIRRMKDPVKANIPIVALTANTRTNDTEKYRAAGMNDCLSKPIGEEKLFQVIARNVPACSEYAIRTGTCLSAEKMQTPEEKLYNLSVIQAVSGGDAEFVKKMVLLFIETVPANIKELIVFTETGNWELVSKMAHKLKSTLDAMGMHVLKQVIRTIELTAKNKEQTEGIPALVHQLNILVNACVLQLEHDMVEREW